MLSDLPASTAVYYDSENGLLRGLDEVKACGGTSRSIVDMCTLSVEHMKKVESEVLSRGGSFLEAPVSGSKSPAATGQLIFLAGGDRAIFDDEGVQADLAAMGKASFFLGHVGGELLFFLERA
jgi:glyoxylate/succinic semialdehyde reductase